MISLKDACEKVLAIHPKEYINCVNKYEKAYQFVLFDKEYEGIHGCPLIINTPGIIIESGELIDDACCMDDIFEGPYKQYDRSDLEKL